MSCIAVPEAALHMPSVCIGEIVPEPYLQTEAMTFTEEKLIASWLTADDDSTVTGKLV